MEGNMSARPISAADIDALLHPARAFAHPQDVVRDPDMTLYEKRAILSSWASDACAVEDVPAMRRAHGIGEVKFDDIMDALRALDLELEQRAHPFRPRTRREKPWPEHSGGVTAF
jgi:hypothetical protein